MNNRMLNDHGQPFSKKQKKASRTMMAMRGSFRMQAPMSEAEKVKAKASKISFGKIMMAMLRRKAS